MQSSVLRAYVPRTRGRRFTFLCKHRLLLVHGIRLGGLVALMSPDWTKHREVSATYMAAALRREEIQMGYSHKEIKEHFMREIRMLTPQFRREQPINDFKPTRFDADYGVGRREETIRNGHYLRKSFSS